MGHMTHLPRGVSVSEWKAMCGKKILSTPLHHRIPNNCLFQLLILPSEYYSRNRDLSDPATVFQSSTELYSFVETW